MTNYGMNMNASSHHVEGKDIGKPLMTRQQVIEAIEAAFFCVEDERVANAKERAALATELQEVLTWVKQ